MICDIKYTSPKCAELLLNVRIITRVVREFCAKAFLHKFTFCFTRFEGRKKGAFNCGRGRNDEETL